MTVAICLRNNASDSEHVVRGAADFVLTVDGSRPRRRECFEEERQKATGPAGFLCCLNLPFRLGVSFINPSARRTRVRGRPRRPAITLAGCQTTSRGILLARLSSSPDANSNRWSSVEGDASTSAGLSRTLRSEGDWLVPIPPASGRDRAG